MQEQPSTNFDKVLFGQLGIFVDIMLTNIDNSFPWVLKRIVVKTFSDIALYISDYSNNLNGDAKKLHELESLLVSVGEAMFNLEYIRFGGVKSLKTSELLSLSNKFWTGVKELKSFLESNQLC